MSLAVIANLRTYVTVLRSIFFERITWRTKTL